MGKLIQQARSPKFSSIAPDPRTEKEQSKDYIVGIDVALPYGIGSPHGAGRIEALKFQPYDQGKTSACGAFAASHARLISEDVENFALSWYRSRSNYPDQGMYLKDVLRLAAKASATPISAKYKNFKPNEEEANKIQLKNLFKKERDTKYEYAKIQPYDVDSVLKAINSGYPCIVSFYSTLDEWDYEMVPKDAVILATAPVRHYVTVIPNSFHRWDDSTWVTVVDSSPHKGFSIRHLSIDFLKERMYLGGGFYYLVTTTKSDVTSVPKERCEYLEKNTKVEKLQLFLREEGYLDAKHITGYYGDITKAAVLKWQKAHIPKSVVTPLDLDELDGRFWGPASIDAAIKKYPNK